MSNDKKKSYPDPQIGYRYGFLKVVSVGRPDKIGRKRFWCRCDCGKRCLVRGWNLKTGRVISCGHTQKGVVLYEDVPRYRCVETDELFNTMKEANVSIGIDENSHEIYYATMRRPPNNTAGFHPETGEPLHWVLEHETVVKKMRPGRSPGRIPNPKPPTEMVLLNTNTLYKGLYETSKQFNVAFSTLRDCLDGKRDFAGHDENGKPLRWMYYDTWKRLFKVVNNDK